MALTRRAFAAATAASVVAPTIARAKECPAAGMDWMTMSLEARNLAYFNVAHVGADFARQKTESWTAASKDLREQRPKHLDLAYGPRERMKWDLRSDPDRQRQLAVPGILGTDRDERRLVSCILRSSAREPGKIQRRRGQRHVRFPDVELPQEQRPADGKGTLPGHHAGAERPCRKPYSVAVVVAGNCYAPHAGRQDQSFGRDRPSARAECA